MGKGDPNKPRGKISAFSYFVQACRDEIQRRHPGGVSYSFTELTRACAERWKITSARERAKFDHMADWDKCRYRREMQCYSSSSPPQQQDAESRARHKRDPNKPKRPLSAFFLFASEHRPQIRAAWPGLSFPETAKKVGQKWSAQTPEERLPYEVRAAELKGKYDQEVAAYRAKRGGGRKSKARATLSVTEAQLEEKMGDDIEDDRRVDGGGYKREEEQAQEPNGERMEEVKVEKMDEVKVENKVEGYTQDNDEE